MDSLNCIENFLFHCHLSVPPKWSVVVLLLRVAIKNLLEKSNQIETKLNSIWIELMGVRLKVQILLESLENKIRLIFKHCDKQVNSN